MKNTIYFYRIRKHSVTMVYITDSIKTAFIIDRKDYECISVVISLDGIGKQKDITSFIIEKTLIVCVWQYLSLLT